MSSLGFTLRILLFTYGLKVQFGELHILGKDFNFVILEIFGYEIGQIPLKHEFCRIPANAFWLVTMANE